MGSSNWWQEDSEPGGSQPDPDGPPPPPPGTGQVNAQWDWSAPADQGGDAHTQVRGQSGARAHAGVPSQPPVTGPVSALMVAFENITNYQGRATRAEFWWLWGTMFIINALASFTIESAWTTGRLTTGAADIADLGILLVSVVVAIPTGVRRMHDSDRSGLWVIVPLVNFVLSLLPSDPGVNRFGPPRQFVGVPGPR